MSGSQPSYDAFVSYSRNDSRWVRETLVPRLESAGLRICVDFRDFEPGSAMLSEIERCILASRHTLMVLTPDYVRNEWSAFERLLTHSLAAKRNSLLPLLVSQCDLPVHLRTLRHLDFADPLGSSLQFEQLIAAIRSARTPDISVLLGQDRSPTTQLGPTSAVSHLPTSSGAVSELPQDVPLFIGREQELAVLSHLLEQRGRDRGRPGLFLVHGAAGVGKSALAIRAANRMRAQFPDGCLFVSLEHQDEFIDSVALLPPLLNALGVTSDALPSTSADQAVLYQSILERRTMLLVFDDVVRASQILALLPMAETCSVLITSRQSLELPGRAQQMALDTLTESAARDLLFRLLPDRELGARSAGKIADMCGRSPLALAIAAATLKRTRDLSAEACVALLRRERGGSKPDQAVAAILALAYGALKPADARTLRLVSLLMGPEFDAESAAALTGDGVAAAGTRLRSIAAHGLLTVTTDGERYGLHDLVRRFARERLQAEEPTLHQRSAIAGAVRWYLSTLSIAASALWAFPDGPEETSRFMDRQAALQWLERERYNLLGLVREAVSVGAIEDVPQLAYKLAAFYSLRRHWRDWIDTYEAALVASRQLADLQAETRLLNNLGVAHRDQGRLVDAASCLERSLVLARSIHDSREESVALTNLGSVRRDEHRPDEAIKCHTLSLTLARKTGDRSTECNALVNLGNACRDQGLVAEARDHYNRGLTLSREIGDRQSEGMCLAGLGAMLEGDGEYGSAIECYERSLAIAQEARDQYGEADAHMDIASAHRLAGNTAAAVYHYRQGLSLALEFANSGVSARALIGLASLERDGGHVREATELYEQALDASRQAGNLRLQLEVLTTLAAMHVDQDHLAAAVACYGSGIELARRIGDGARETALRVSLADVHSRSGELEQAIEDYEYALGLMRDQNDVDGEGELLTRLAATYVANDREAEAAVCLERRHAIAHMLRTNDNRLEEVEK